MARMPNNVTIGLYTTGTCKVAYDPAGRRARRFAIKWLAAPRARGAAGEGRPHRRQRRALNCFFLPRKKRCLRHRYQPAAGGPLHMHGVAWVAWVSWVAWCFGVSIAPPPSVPTKNTPQCKGRQRHVRQFANLGTSMVQTAQMIALACKACRQNGLGSGFYER